MTFNCRVCGYPIAIAADGDGGYEPGVCPMCSAEIDNDDVEAVATPPPSLYDKQPRSSMNKQIAKKIEKLKEDVQSLITELESAIEKETNESEELEPILEFLNDAKSDLDDIATT